jgi:HSP20 family protein
MADSKNRSDTSKEGGPALARQDRDRNIGQRREAALAPLTNPFAFMDQMTQEMDRMFDRVLNDFGFPRRSWLSRSASPSSNREAVWSPRIEAFQKGDRFVVRAELPGLKKDDVHVELTDDALTIQGELRQEQEQEREGYYHSEREYGQFYRSIPLPEGVITESAQALFKNGVLEIAMQAPPAEANRGRRIEIKDAEDANKK